MCAVVESRQRGSLPAAPAPPGVRGSVRCEARSEALVQWARNLLPIDRRIDSVLASARSVEAFQSLSSSIAKNGAGSAPRCQRSHDKN